MGRNSNRGSAKPVTSLPSALRRPGRRGTMAKPSGRSPTDVDTEPRERRFMKSALAILGETGRTDFTVLEVVERSKTSLRSFYQHFSSKDELLLALIDKIMAESTQRWRGDADGRAGPQRRGPRVGRAATR